MSRTAPGRHGRLFDVTAVGLAALLALALILPTYARRPFWFDELVSLEVADNGFASLVDYVATVEANMALYHVLLSGWLVVTESEAGVRALSIVFAVGALPFVYALALRLYDRRTAVVAVLLASVNVSFVGYARDARSYALALLLVAAAGWALHRAVDSARRRDWVVYGVVAGLAVWAHLFAFLVVAAHLVWLALERPRGRQRRGAAVGMATLGLLLAPLVVAVLAGSQQPQLDWLPAPGVQKLPGLLQWFVESRATVVVYFVGGAAALVGGLAAWRADRRSWPSREGFLVLWLLLPPVAGYLASSITPLYLYRYFLVCLPALVILVAAGFARIRPAWLGIGLAAVALLLSVRTVASCQPDCKIRHDDWGSAMSYLTARARPGDAIVVYPREVRTPVDRHLPGDRPRLRYPERWELVGGTRRGQEELGPAITRAGEHPRVWLVTWWLPSERARTALTRRATLDSAREFQGNVRVELYRPRQFDR